MVRTLVVTGVLALFLAGPAAAETSLLPAHVVVSEDLSEQRRAVFVRLERRLDEADLQRLGETIRHQGKRDYARTQVNYFLPGMPFNQGPWASVAFSTEAKVVVHGLRREDEDLFVAEHRGDRRPLLGSWLTSPPAAPGRLSIYSDSGRIYAEWRLRSGQRTVDELLEGSVKSGRRFDVVGGGYYVLTRSGELEIWDKTTLIATAERIRPENLALPSAVALGPKTLVPALTIAPPVRHPAAEMPVSPVQPEPRALPVPSASTSGASAAVTRPAAVTAILPPEPVEPRTKPRKAAKAKARPGGLVQASKSGVAQSAGDQIAAQLSGR